MTGLDMVIWLLVLLVIFAKPNQVPQDERWVLSIFGAYSRTLNPGLQFTVRWIEEIATTRQDQTVSVAEVVTEKDETKKTRIVQEFGVDKKYKETPKGVRSTRTYVRDMIVENTITQDGITIPEIQCQLSNRLMTETENDVVNKSVGKPHRDASYKNTYVLGAPMKEALKGLVNGTVRSVIGKHEMQVILDDPNSIKKEIEEEMREEMKLWGEHLNRLLISEFVPPDDIQVSLQAPFKAKKAGEALVATAEKEAQAATQRALATVTEANAKRDAAIAEAEGVRQAMLKEAEGKRASLVKMAKLFGYKTGEDEDTANNFQATQSAAEYMTVEERLRAVTAIGAGSGTVLISAGAEGLMASTLAMIGKSVRDKGEGKTS